MHQEKGGVAIGEVNGMKKTNEERAKEREAPSLKTRRGRRGVKQRMKRKTRVPAIA